MSAAWKRSSRSAWSGSASAVAAGGFRTSIAGHVRIVLAEDVLDASEEAAVVLIFDRRRRELVLRQRRGELFEQLLLFACQLSRRCHPHGDEQIATSAATHIRHAARFQLEHVAGVGPTGHRQ